MFCPKARKTPKACWFPLLKGLKISHRWQFVTAANWRTNLYYRVYGKYFDRDGLVTSSGADAKDDWNSVQGGTRLDWEPSDENKFTLQGSFYNDFVHENENVVTLVPPYVANTNAENHDVGRQCDGPLDA